MGSLLRFQKIYTARTSLHRGWQSRRLQHSSPKAVPAAWNSKEIRSTFISYFRDQNNHEYVPSSSVVPKKDDGTYFINAGMNQFKPIFLGTADQTSVLSRYSRVVNSQKCIRIGGKHNDLNDVGRDLSHHTFFEMLGSWSFADYFKTDACTMAWDLITNVFCLPKDRLYVTYFGGDKSLGLQPDNECREIWLSLGISEDRILPFNSKENFWEMGFHGPCGPCTELHYDYVGGRSAANLVNTGSPEVVELWNLVFMQYNRLSNNKMIELPKCHVDTGMGLERLTSILQNTRSNYDTDLFQPIFDAVHKNYGCPSYLGNVGAADENGIDTAYRIVADHARMFSVAISDGIMPGRAGLEHRVRNIIHRSIRYSTQVLKGSPGQLAGLVPVIVDSLGDTYPELKKNCQKVIDVVNETEEKYLNLRNEAEQVFLNAIDGMKTQMSLSGAQIFELIDGRHGKPVPLDLLQEIAGERNIKLDMNSYNNLVERMKEVQMSAEKAKKLKVVRLGVEHLEQLQKQKIPTTDCSNVYQYNKVEGKYEFPSVKTEIVALLYGGELVQSVPDGVECGVIVKNTNFYAECGGQLADKGSMTGNRNAMFHVRDVQTYKSYTLHTGVVEQGLKVGDNVVLNVDEEHRENCMMNHTGTHIVSQALRQVLGDVKQCGSLVASDRLTFNFTCDKSVPVEKLGEIQVIVNEIIDKDLAVFRNEVPLEKALTIPNIVTLKDELYPKEVKVISIGGPKENVSVELCGGTHVFNTGDLSSLVITKLTGLGHGTKKLEAVTGEAAVEAKEAAYELRQAQEKLEKVIEKGIAPETWGLQMKIIDTVLSDKILPKLDRDQIHSDLEQVRSKIKEYLNAKARENLRMMVSSLLPLSKPCLVAALPFDQPRNMVAVLSKLSPEIPVMIFNKHKDMLRGVCYVPSGTTNLSADDWAGQVCESVSGKQQAPTVKVPNPSDFSVMVIKSPEKMKEAMDLAKKLIEENLQSS